MEPDSSLQRVFRTTVLISGAMVASLFLYALLVELIRTQLKPFPGVLGAGLGHPTLRYAFYAAAVGAVVLVRLAARSALKVRPGEDQRGLVSRLSRASVVTSALAEIPAVLGLVLFLLTGLSRDFYPLLFVSLFLEFMYFPRLRVWQDLAGQGSTKRGI